MIGTIIRQLFYSYFFDKKYNKSKWIPRISPFRQVKDFRIVPFWLVYRCWHLSESISIRFVKYRWRKVAGWEV